jgi:superfamily I DNA and RNA helicase
LGLQELFGECFFGFPLFATPEGKYSIDAMLISPNKGIVLFDLIEGKNTVGYEDRQDDLANKLEARLKYYRELLRGRNLLVPFRVLSFVPALTNVKNYDSEHPLVNENNLAEVLSEIEWIDGNDELYRKTLSAVENLSAIRKSRTKREVVHEDSRGAKLKELENSIATLDYGQGRAVIETVEGVQRIRGLAGSGKTIVLALKAAYLHTQHSDWRIAVTFNTRSLKGQFRRLIYNFCIEQSGEEPDWAKVRIVNAWGAPGGEERDGIYYEYCRVTGQDYFDFQRASNHFIDSREKIFSAVCKEALKVPASNPDSECYDVILVDEAQDFDSSFLRLCYAMLRQPKRLVYAYDELQNLTDMSLPPPEEIFGKDAHGTPVVSLGDSSNRDVILQKCYRNSRPVLVTAHALGFGIEREQPQGAQTGLVQMFEHPTLWEAIGYRVRSGRLAKGHPVILERTDETSPSFLERHSLIDDLVCFKCFRDEKEQNEWLIDQIRQNVEKDELLCDDIIVIHTVPETARKRLGPIGKALFERGIRSHIAGVDTSADVFFKTGTSSITLTGIYRAKGNEAGMVYIIDAQDCAGFGIGLATLRNRLFTAITRSKAWVRILGYGDGMVRLMNEFENLKNDDFRLSFTYPTDDVLKKLRIVHRDLPAEEKERLEQKKESVLNLIDAFERRELTPDDLEEETRQKLLSWLGGHK